MDHKAEVAGGKGGKGGRKARARLVLLLYLRIFFGRKGCNPNVGERVVGARNRAG
jgi:hypothetical protein